MLDKMGRDWAEMGQAQSSLVTYGWFNVTLTVIFDLFEKDPNIIEKCFEYLHNSKVVQHFSKKEN